VPKCNTNGGYTEGREIPGLIGKPRKYNAMSIIPERESGFDAYI
jgi:hypothetical protein